MTMRYRLWLIDVNEVEICSFESDTLPVRGEVISLRPPDSERNRTLLVTEVQRNIGVIKGMWSETSTVHVSVVDKT